MSRGKAPSLSTLNASSQPPLRIMTQKGHSAGGSCAAAASAGALDEEGGASSAAIAVFVFLLRWPALRAG